MYCTERSNYLDDEDEHILEGLPKIPELRRILQDQRRFDACQSLMQYEKYLDDYDASQTLDTYRSFFETFPVCVSMRDATESVRTKLALTCVYHAEALALVGQDVESRNQLALVRELLSNGNAVSHQPAMHMPPTIQLWLSKIHARSHASSNPMDRKTASLRCAKEAKAMQDWSIYREHLRDALEQSWELKETGDLATRDEEVKDYVRTLTIYTEFEDRVTHSALFLSHAIWRYGVAANQQGGNLLEHFLDLVKTYEQDFPHFLVPLTIVSRAGTVAKVMGMLGDEVGSNIYYALERKWIDRCPWMVKRAGGYVPKDDLPNRFSHKRWSYNSKDPKRRTEATIAARLIIQWATREMHEHQLSKAEMKHLVQWDRLQQAFLEDPSWTHDLELTALPTTAPDKFSNTFFNSETPVEPSVWDPWFSTLHTWLKLDRLPSRLQRLNLLIEIQGQRCWNVLNSTNAIRPFPSSVLHKVWRIKEEKRLLLLLQEIRKSDPKLVGEYEIRVSQSQYAGAIGNLAITRGAKEHGSLTDHLIQEAIDNYNVLINAWKASEELPKLLRTLNYLGLLTWICWSKFQSVDGACCLPIFRQAEELYRRIRIQASVRSSSRALMSKTMLAQDLNMPLVYEVARCAALVAHKQYQPARQDASETVKATSVSEMEARRFDLIYWCQGSKAQALTDVLGLEAEIPASMMASIQESEGAIRGLAREKDIISEMNRASLGRKVQLRNELDELQASMLRDEPSLKPVFDIRSGIPPSPESFTELAAQLGNNAVIIDWMVVFGLGVPIWMLIYRAGKLSNVVPIRYMPKKALPLTFSHIPKVIDWLATCESGNANLPEHPRSLPDAIWMSQLNTWVDDNLTEHIPLCRAFEDDPDSSNHLNCRLLLGLVSPLLEHTKPGEKLLFCPTQILHRLPLHALQLAGTPIIERNPVTYIQSTSLLSFTLWLSEQAATEKQSALRAIIFNTLSDNLKALQSVQRLNNILGKSATTSSHCTKESFAQLGAEADIIHTHGHIVFEPNDPMPLKHHLVLGHPEDDPKNQLTADEICDMKLRRGALVMAMGCNSGRARQTDCDDLVGLTAAFHCAGAGSVVSTLWMIDAGDCEVFASAFYGSLVAQLRAEDGGSGYADLAVAMQDGVAAVRFDAVGRERDPYHWAGFVLHGSWRFARRRLL